MTLDEINAEIAEVRKARAGEKAMENLQKAMSGAAEEAWLKSEEDVVEMVKELRAEDRKETPSGEFAEQILKELIDEGYSGYELLDEFRIRQAKVKPAVETMLEEAKNVANGNGEYMTYEDFIEEVIENNDCDTILSKNDLLRINAEKMDPIEYMGYQEGLEIGIQIGENNVNKSVSLKMYQDGYSPEYIAKLLQLRSEQVMEWIEEK